MLTPKQIPTTGRSSIFQVNQMGFKTIAAFAKTIPKNGLVLDIGAGLSQLGEEVTSIRNDITWVNIDPYYENGKTNTNAKLKYLAPDITKPDSSLKKLRGKADIVYTYWMIPHLSLETDAPALEALKQMKLLLKDDGLLMVGPVKKTGFGLISPFRYKGLIKHTKKELSDDAINRIVDMTKLWWLPRFIQKQSNKHDVHLLKRFVGGV